jgi:hypothetical protein
MVPMALADRERVGDLSRRCKTGYVPTPGEMSYLELMFATYPEDYLAISEETRRWANQMMNPLYLKSESERPDGAGGEK